MIRYAHLKWPEISRKLAREWLIIPVGSVEQHGPHLPLCVDTVLAVGLAEMVAGQGGVVAPPLEYGARSLPNSGGGPSYPGTIHLQGDLLIQWYRQVLGAYVSQGAKKLLVLNGHWENEGALFEALDQLRELRALEGVEVICLSWWSLVKNEEMESIFGEFRGWHVEHAGQAETALMLHFAPDLVDMRAAADHDEEIPCGIYRLPTPSGWTGNQGILCQTRRATAAMGGQLAAIVAERLNELLAPASSSKPKKKKK